MKYSVVLPVRNEAQNAGPLLASLYQVLVPMAQDFEIIFVDDGSTDKTVESLRRHSLSDGRLHILRFLKPRGQSAALQAGFDCARGSVIITLDGDGQLDPRDIPAMIRKLEEGFDLVCGWRVHRQDAVSKKAASFLANFLRRTVFGERIHDVGCSLKVLRKGVLQDIYLSGSRHRFLTAIAHRKGARITEWPVRHYDRKAGRSKYKILDRFCASFKDFWIIFFDVPVSRPARAATLPDGILTL